MNILISISPNYKFGIDEKQILQVVSEPECIYPDGLPSLCSYAIDYQGAPLPVVKLSRIIEESMIEDPGSSVIVTRIKPEGITCGISVGWIHKMVALKKNRLHQVPQLIRRNIKKNFLWGLMVTEDELILLINLDELFTGDELKSLIRFQENNSQAETQIKSRPSE